MIIMKVFFRDVYSNGFFSLPIGRRVRDNFPVMATRKHKLEQGVGRGEGLRD